jgi:hypothetical protein
MHRQLKNIKTIIIQTQLQHITVLLGCSYQHVIRCSLMDEINLIYNDC